MCRHTHASVACCTNQYKSWEVVDPEKWVPDGYVCVRVDSRGAGRSPGYLNHNNARENRDFHDCIEWAAAQPWCSGKVGLNGISYYASSQWRAAALQPPHLAAMCVWEGWVDYYRDSVRPGGISYDPQRQRPRAGAAPAAPRRDVRLGRLGGLLPRFGAARRHRLHLPQALAGHAGEDRAARARRARAEEPRHRRVGVRAGDIARGRACEKSHRHVDGRARAPACRTLL